MALLRCLSRSGRRCTVLSLAVLVTWFGLSLLALSVPAADDDGGPWLAGEGRTVKLVRADNSHRNILDLGVAWEGGEANVGQKEEEELVVPAVDISTSPSVDQSDRPSPSVDQSDRPLPSLDQSEQTSRAAGTESGCDGPWPGYPQCGDKIQWMMDHWETDKCYAEHGVDGTQCSMQIYLSEVESFCPYLPEREQIISGLASQFSPATLRFEVDGLLDVLRENVKFEWISNRIARLWPQWSHALRTLQAQKPFSHSTAYVLIHIGALSDKAGFHFAENAGKGGPLGELVQWSDLIASLHALGYNIDFSTEIAQLKSSLVVNNRGGCPTISETKYTTVFVDIVGLKQLKKLTKNRFAMYKCLLRVLDTFGTEPVFNYKKWKPEKDDRSSDYGHTWGNWELNPRQFWTMYHNSFLGFVVEQHKSSSSPPPVSNKALVYGKELYMWKGKSAYLNNTAKYFDIHATIGTTVRKGESKPDWSIVPSFVYNHGILSGAEVQQLLQESRVFVGLGFPYEGPAPLEAIAQGCVFLNPKLNPPIDRTNSKFFQKKPTNRQIDSQNPYVATFVGEPYVYTFDAENMTEVELTIQRILEQPRPPPYLPYEFTFAGMLERVTAYLNNQQYCRPRQWPPSDSLITRVGKPGTSCKQTCYDEGLVCEPELFHLLNNEEAFADNGIECPSVRRGHSVHAPSLVTNDSHCSLQDDNLLLSCAGSKEGVQRLCPCRQYRKGQVALCLSCSK